MTVIIQRVCGVSWRPQRPTRQLLRVSSGRTIGTNDVSRERRDVRASHLVMTNCKSIRSSDVELGSRLSERWVRDTEAGSSVTVGPRSNSSVCWSSRVGASRELIDSSVTKARIAERSQLYKDKVDVYCFEPARQELGRDSLCVMRTEVRSMVNGQR